MFTFEPAFWLIVMAIGISVLSAVVILASSMISQEDERSLGALSGQTRGRLGEERAAR